MLLQRGRARRVARALGWVAGVPRCALLLGCSGLGLTSPAAYACASCGCSLSSDAALGYTNRPGWRLSLQYDYINQDELRSGTHRISAVPDGAELERDTLNRYVTAGLAYSPSAAWDLQVQVPYVMRTHQTYGEFDSTQPLPPTSNSRSSSLGDLRLLADYQGFLPTHNLGVRIGVKLPTGHYGTAVDFNSGPAAGEPLDASLQPGTGSTDLIVGAYYYQAVSQNFDVVANAQFQSALAHHLNQPGEDYRPGNSTTVSLGIRYAGYAQRWTPQLQLNLLRKAPDQGALADVQNTAGTVAYVSPGARINVMKRLQLFGFVQVPVYSNLYGDQLFPRYTVSAGLSYAF